MRELWEGSVMSGWNGKTTNATLRSAEILKRQEKTGLAAGDGADDQEGFFAGGDFGRQRRVPGFVGEVFGAGEEAQEWAALLRIVVADGAAQHGIAGF